MSRTATGSMCRTGSRPNCPPDFPTAFSDSEGEPDAPFSEHAFRPAPVSCRSVAARTGRAARATRRVDLVWRVRPRHDGHRLSRLAPFAALDHPLLGLSRRQSGLVALGGRTGRLGAGAPAGHARRHGPLHAHPLLSAACRAWPSPARRPRAVARSSPALHRRRRHRFLDGSFAASAQCALGRRTCTSSRWRLDRLWQRSGRVALLAAGADHARQCRSSGKGMDLPHRQADRRQARHRLSGQSAQGGQSSVPVRWQ